MNEPIFYYKNFSSENYARVLNNTPCCVGNSSSLIREAGYLGVPSVIVGDRQQGRQHGRNVFASCDQNEIAEQLQAQIAHGGYESDRRFGNGFESQRIAAKLAALDLRHKTCGRLE
jgi:UDP-N-acetylglucosamine 2-epimerase